jgi:predicted Zn-dependent protease
VRTVNTSTRVFVAGGFLRVFLSLLAMGSPSAYAAEEAIALPDIGDSASAALPLQEERRLGEAFLREVRRSAKVVEDPFLQDYLAALGQRLVGHSGTQGQEFRFFLIDDPQINAFAGPDGYIGVNTGLVTETQSESELAAVLAHEISHVTQRHLARQVEGVKRLALPTAAALLAAVALARQSGELGQAAMASVAAGSLQERIDSTRSKEAEADRIGIEMLVAAQFDPHSMGKFFERLQYATRFYGKPPEFLSTHPVTRERIAEAAERAERHERRPPADGLTYHLVKAQLVLRSNPDPRVARRYFQDALEKGQAKNPSAMRYGHALALNAEGKHEAARREIGQLLAKDGDQVAYRLARARIDVDSGQARQAVEDLEAALPLYPTHRALTLQLGEALLATGDVSRGRDLLRRYLARQGGEPALYDLLARTYAAAGDRPAAHQAQAELSYLNGDTAGAVEQLQAALKQSGDDFYAASRIEARLRELEALLPEERKR